MVICLEQGADLHMAQLMPLPLTVSCFSKIQIGFSILVPAHPGSPGQRAVKWVCVCVCKHCVRCILFLCQTATNLIGRQRHYIFHLSAHLCVHAYPAEPFSDWLALSFYLLLLLCLSYNQRVCCMIVYEQEQCSITR